MASEDWRAPSFRQNMISKIDESIQKFGKPILKNASEMESQVFAKAKSREEYLSYIARLLLHVNQINNKKLGQVVQQGANNAGTNVQQGMPDPINALQTLARQGTGNERAMGLPVQGPNSQGMVPQQPPTGNPASNLLQTLTQRPGQTMNMQSMHKMQGMNMMPVQTGGPPMSVNQMGQMQGMQANPMMTQMNQMNQGNMQQTPMGHQTNQPTMNSQQLGSGAQINTQQLGPNQMQQAIQNQMQNQMAGHQMQNQIGGQMNAMPGGMPPQQAPQNQQQQQLSMNQISANQLGHMQRKPVDIMNPGFPGPRNVTPTQFLRQSPSPSAPSPGGLGAPTPSSNQMVNSPALAPSPNPQHAMLGGPQRSIGMVSSPSSSLNTPAGASGATPSPLQEEQAYQAYKDKIRKLSKYIEPLRKVILKTTKEGNTEKMSKMKKLLELLTNPSSSTKLDILNKCEIVLQKMDLTKFETTSSVAPPNLKEHHLFSPLLDVVSSLLQSPVANHTLQRTFGPCLEALFGPEMKDLPPPLKKQKVEESSYDIPDVLQGEIARLDQRFKISLDPTQQNGSKCIHLICWLDDKHLPCVPPISVIVPSDYPSHPPRCYLASHEYTTSYLNAVQKALDARLAKLPKMFSISQLLDTWEMSVRQASAPKLLQTEYHMPVTTLPSFGSISVTVTTTSPTMTNATATIANTVTTASVTPVTNTTSS